MHHQKNAPTSQDGSRIQCEGPGRAGAPRGHASSCLSQPLAEASLRGHRFADVTRVQGPGPPPPGKLSPSRLEGGPGPAAGARGPVFCPTNHLSLGIGAPNSALQTTESHRSVRNYLHRKQINYAFRVSPNR